MIIAVGGTETTRSHIQKHSEKSPLSAAKHIARSGLIKFTERPLEWSVDLYYRADPHRVQCRI